MRKPPALRALFPTIRGDVLAATFTQPEKWWYLSELAEFLRTTPSSLQRELKALVDAGILEQRRDGTRTYYKAEARSPLFGELRGLFEKTAGVVPTIREVLAPFRKQIDCAFVYGLRPLQMSITMMPSALPAMVLRQVGSQRDPPRIQ